MADANRTAVILFAHGARDPRWGASLEALARAVEARRPGVTACAAYLEIQSPRLPQALEAAAAAGARHVDIVPVFWAGAGHVDNELPPMVSEFSARHPDIPVRTLPVLSELPGMLEFIASVIAAHPA
jgi:sirohydrochlorin cobaltochelatase